MNSLPGDPKSIKIQWHWFQESRKNFLFFSHASPTSSWFFVNFFLLVDYFIAFYLPVQWLEKNVVEVKRFYINGSDSYLLKTLKCLRKFRETIGVAKNLEIWLKTSICKGKFEEKALILEVFLLQMRSFMSIFTANLFLAPEQIFRHLRKRELSN